MSEREVEPILQRSAQPARGMPVSDQSRLSQEYYDSLAAEFTEMDDYWRNPYDSATWKMENRLVRRHLSNAEDILDLGVGFYPHVESTAGKHVVCLDISSRSLDVARTMYHTHNERTEYVCADALAVPYPNGSFGGVIAGGELINHVGAERLLNEIARLLQPRGKAIVSVGMKWCLDSLCAVVDALLGSGIGYSMTHQEARDFLRHPRSSPKVTWEVTPHYDLAVTLYSRTHLKSMLYSTGLRIVSIRSLNLASGMIPLPVQQSQSIGTAMRVLTDVLLWTDSRILCRIPGVRWFAGNVYLVLEKP